MTGREWPRVFHSDVNIFGGNSGHGDVKYVWELNRFHFLPLLGKAWQLTGEDIYARGVVQLIEDWIGANPYKLGINWSSMLELAVRSLSWLHALSLIDGSPALDESARSRIAANLLLHGQCIREHLSTYFSPYNHLIGEAAALYAIGTALETERAKEWLRTGREILETEVPRQWYEDGGTVEQASGYHYFTLGFYLQALLLARANGREHAVLLTSVERAAEFGMHLVRPDGLTSMIGDGDEGHALQLLRPTFWDFRPFTAVVAALTGRADLAHVGGPLPEDAWWLTGISESLQAVPASSSAGTSSSTLLAASGYAIMRSDESAKANWLLFDCGELAHGVRTDDVPSAAHGHADALSIEVCAFGKPALIDPGFYTYNGALPWHTHFRNTEGHNALTVDGRSQAVFRGRLKWSNGPSVKHSDWFASDAFDHIVASHDAWKRLLHIEHFRRVLFLKPNLWIVRDDVVGSGQHAIDRHWHCTAVPRELGPAAFSVDVGAGEALSVQALEDGARMTVRSGLDDPGGGWAATGYETKVSAPYVQVHASLALPATLYTIIEACPNDHPTWAHSRQADRLLLERGDERIVCRFTGSEAPLASRVSWTHSIGGTLMGAGVINGTTLGEEASPVARLAAPGSAGWIRRSPQPSLQSTVALATAGSRSTPEETR